MVFKILQRNAANLLNLLNLVFLLSSDNLKELLTDTIPWCLPWHLHREQKTIWHYNIVLLPLVTVPLSPLSLEAFPQTLEYFGSANNERLFLFKQVICIKSKITDLQVIKLKTCGTRILVEGGLSGPRVKNYAECQYLRYLFFFRDKNVTRSRECLRN